MPHYAPLTTLKAKCRQWRTVIETVATVKSGHTEFMQ